jgi:hypothetical protein
LIGERGAVAGPRQSRIEKALDYSKMSAKQLKEHMDGERRHQQSAAEVRGEGGFFFLLPFLFFFA